ncbi:MAG: hypothetical protein PHO01_03570 [Desulfotomaculaceae bacterium]|nr:hypothetical protein [Desulfotomaculaceae bacterium]
MLITTNAVLAMRCPECGKMDVHKFSRFSLPRGKVLSINCSCGANKFEITRNRTGYLLKFACMACETEHFLEISSNILWSEGITSLFCQDTGIELGSLGPAAKIDEMVFRQEQEMEYLLDELESDSYFHNPEIMYEVLNCLHHIASEGGLYCQCGDFKIEVDIFPDRLELHCQNCDSINIIYAETEEDLSVIQQIDSIELAMHGFKCLDSLSNTGKSKKIRRKRNKT